MICVDCNTSQYQPEKCVECNKALPYADHDPDGMKFWTGCRNIFLVAALLFFLCMIIFWLPSCANASMLNIDLGLGMSDRTLTKDGDYYQSYFQKNNSEKDFAYFVGVSGTAIENGSWSLTWDAKYFDMGKGSGNNFICYPDGCVEHTATRGHEGKNPVWMGQMITEQEFSYVTTTGIGIQYKKNNFFIRPEGGIVFAKSTLTTRLIEKNGTVRGTSEVENSITSYYFGGAIGYQTKYADIFFIARHFPESGGQQMMFKDTTFYGFGISIPVWN